MELRLDLAVISLLLTVGFAQGYVWVSYFASRRILECQADAVIGGRYSCAIGAISSLAFLLLVILYWHLDMLSFEAGGLMYLLNLLPNMLQYVFMWLGWGTMRFGGCAGWLC